MLFLRNGVTTLVVVCVLLHSAPLSGQTATAGELPLVWVLSTGGTIAGRGASSTSLTDYKAGSILGEQLVANVPEIKKVATVKVEQIANVNSSDITIDIWLTLANRINTILRTDPKVAGVVVTHGTNTLEETAYFLNLTVKG
jgi:L-asparaginase